MIWKGWGTKPNLIGKSIIPDTFTILGTKGTRGNSLFLSFVPRFKPCIFNGFQAIKIGRNRFFTFFGFMANKRLSYRGKKYFEFRKYIILQYLYIFYFKLFYYTVPLFPMLYRCSNLLLPEREHIESSFCSLLFPLLKYLPPYRKGFELIETLYFQWFQVLISYHKNLYSMKFVSHFQVLFPLF